MEEARHIAAQCWCDEETKDREMDSILAEAVARRIAPWMEVAAQSQRKVDYYRGLLEQFMSDAPDPPPPEPMSQAEQVFAFKQDLEALVGRYSAEFDMEPETILGALQCHAYLMLAEMTMCYTDTLPLDEDGDDEDRPEDWQQ